MCRGGGRNVRVHATFLLAQVIAHCKDVSFLGWLGDVPSLAKRAGLAVVRVTIVAKCGVSAQVHTVRRYRSTC